MRRQSSIIQIELDGLQQELKPLLVKERTLIRELREAKSYETIAALDIHRDDIVESNGEGRPYFYIDSKFVQWITEQRLTHKRYAEWNGTIYPMHEFLDGRLRCIGNSDIRLDDVINYRKKAKP